MIKNTRVFVKIENEKEMKLATEIIKKTAIRNAEFVNDVEKSNDLEFDSIALSEEEFNTIARESIMAIAMAEGIESFEASFDFDTDDIDGCEGYYEAVFEEGLLTLKSLWTENAYGHCPECDELVHYTMAEYCENCNAEFDEEEAFPNGVPEEKEFKFEIKK